MTAAAAVSPLRNVVVGERQEVMMECPCGVTAVGRCGDCGKGLCWTCGDGGVGSGHPGFRHRTCGPFAAASRRHQQHAADEAQRAARARDWFQENGSRIYRENPGLRAALFDPSVKGGEPIRQVCALLARPEELAYYRKSCRSIRRRGWHQANGRVDIRVGFVALPSRVAVDEKGELLPLAHATSGRVPSRLLNKVDFCMGGGSVWTWSGMGGGTKQHTDLLEYAQRNGLR